MTTQQEIPSYWFCHRTMVHFGQGTLEKAGEIAAMGRKALIVTGRSWVRKSGVLKRVEKLLDAAGVDYVEFCEVEENPSSVTVDRAAELARREECDTVLAIGGGSAMDAGKAAALVAANEGSCNDYYGEVEGAKPALPVMAVPTTSGSGSEVTRYAVITDSGIDLKKTISTFDIAPRVALCDPELTVSLTPRLTASTGMDVLCHAVEGYLSTEHNQISDALAIEAILIVRSDLPTAVRNPSDLDTRLNMMRAAMFGGMVVNHTGTILPHGIGYALTLDAGLQHGEASAMVLPYFLDRIYAQERIRVDHLTHLMGGGEGGGVFKEFMKGLGLHGSLRDTGVAESDLEILARHAMENSARALTRMSVDLTLKDFQSMLRAAYEGK